jgi:hypothetical protein
VERTWVLSVYKGVILGRRREMGELEPEMEEVFIDVGCILGPGPQSCETFWRTVLKESLKDERWIKLLTESSVSLVEGTLDSQQVHGDLTEKLSGQKAGCLQRGRSLSTEGHRWTEGTLGTERGLCVHVKFSTWSLVCGQY